MGHYITVKNSLLEPKHVVAMGASVWLFMWFLDSVMAINENGIGKVLNGRPVIFEEHVQPALGISRRTYTRWITQLRDTGYIRTIQTPYGLVIMVTKADKMWGKNFKQPQVELFLDKRSATSGTSKKLKPKKAKRDEPNMASPDEPKVVYPLDKNGTSNNNNINNNINNTKVLGDTAAKQLKTPKPEIDDLFSYWNLTTGYAIQAKVRQNRYACSNLIKRFGVDGVRRLVDGANQAQADRYAPSVSDFTELQSNLNKLIAWGKKRQQGGNNVEVIS